ncbi:hypothetical protein ATANTOWER_028266 [Ataeniobius toweri]|uniref:Uncharacterized protein n=1 Tax=Ataeniobius toweri TaxID=208326 RepID=A0ABU7ASY5_9TELE|nr:hypothetical protein [Ataeniobius toweri]
MPPSPASDRSHNKASKATKHDPHQHQGHKYPTIPDQKCQAHPNANPEPALAHAAPIDNRTQTAITSQAVKQTLRRTYHCAKGKYGSPASQRVPQKDHSPHSKKAAQLQPASQPNHADLSNPSP